MFSFTLFLGLCTGKYDRLHNSLALTPPMGWRSWNCFHADVTQDKMQGIMDKMTDRTRMVDGKPTSLVDLGFDNVGLDDGMYIDFNRLSLVIYLHVVHPLFLSCSMASVRCGREGHILRQDGQADRQQNHIPKPEGHDRLRPLKGFACGKRMKKTPTFACLIFHPLLGYI